MRQHFKTSRASEYFDPDELRKRTGMGRQYWTEALFKELMDNALDITDGTDAEIEIRLTDTSLSVWDNGPGMSCELIKKMLDFTSRVSDKSAYMGPTRGQQGNAFKTFLGIALHKGGPVEIASQCLLHTISCEANPAGDIDVDHRIDDHTCTGTKITINGVEGQFDSDLEGQVFKYHLVNPFVQIRYFPSEEPTISEESKDPVLYKLAGSLNKIRVDDPTSPLWYSLEKFKALAYLSAKEGVPAGEFIGSFHGLKTSKKKKLVAGGLDMAGIEANAAEVLARMKEHSRPVNPKKIGLIGKKTLVDILRPSRHWYRKTTGTHDGKPWAFEIMVAVSGCSGCCTAVNHSITFEDFTWTTMKDDWLWASSFKDAERLVGASGLFIMAHYIGISPKFVSLGKDKIKFPEEVHDAISRQTRLAFNELHKEDKANDRADRKEQQSRQRQPEKEMSIADAVALVAEAAVIKATSNYTITASARDVYYAARKMIQAYTSKELKGGTFSREIEKYWQSIGGRSEWVHYDARGFLYEPHTGVEIPLGTKGVAGYQSPSWLYDKVLYVEKKGVAASIIEMELPEKYDMAIVGSAGFSTVAARDMLRQAQEHGCTIFVFRDCDPAGYEIVRTLSEPTATMPDNDITVVDLGLDVATCIELGLETETFTQKGNLPSGQNFTEQELEWFQGEPGHYTDKRGKRKKCWTDCKRVEINEMVAVDRVKYLDKKIGDYLGGPQKVIPPKSVQRDKATDLFAGKLDQIATNYYAEKVETLRDRLKKEHSLPDVDLEVAGYLKKNKYKSWKAGISAKVFELAKDIKVEDRHL